MASWRDNLKEASFRGVKFRYSEVETSAGRRSVVHEFPLRDNPSVDDLARAPRTFSITAYVIGTNEKGQNYMEQRDALREAIEQRGPGEFQHPYWGKFLVAVDPGSPVRIRESAREGGMATFSITFLAVSELIQPEAAEDTVKAVTAKSGSFLDSVKAWVKEKLSLISLPEDFRKKAQEVVDKINETVQEAKAIVATVTEKLDEVEQAVQEFADKAQEVVAFVQEADAAIRKVLKVIVGGIKDVETALAVMRKVLAFVEKLEKITGTTPARVQQAENQEALSILFRTAAVVEVANFIAGFEFETREDAERARDEICEALSELAENSDGEVAGKLLDLRAAIARHVAATAADLAVLRSYTPRRTTPDVVIAHELYGDASRAEEITARNRIRHPLFVQGGEPLEVIADA